MQRMISRIWRDSEMNMAGDLFETLGRKMENFDAGAWEQKNADRYNASRGALKDMDCPKCLNRGNFMRIERTETGFNEVYNPCECMVKRLSLARLRRSGLEEGVKRCRFDNYRASEAWQETVLDAARRYVAEDGDAWFFVGGAVGAGKTHICTAICGDLMERMPVQYAVWPEELQKLKATQFDADEYSPRMQQLMNVDLLYLDDFLKIAAGKEPSAADVRIAHELLNHRYVARKKTIISSERYLGEIADIDQAIGGRIAERAKGYTLNLQRTRSKDYRMKIAGEVI